MNKEKEICREDQDSSQPPSYRDTLRGTHDNVQMEIDSSEEDVDVSDDDLSDEDDKGAWLAWGCPGKRKLIPGKYGKLA